MKLSESFYSIRRGVPMQPYSHMLRYLAHIAICVCDTVFTFNLQVSGLDLELEEAPSKPPDQHFVMVTFVVMRLVSFVNLIGYSAIIIIHAMYSVLYTSPKHARMYSV